MAVISDVEIKSGYTGTYSTGANTIKLLVTVTVSSAKSGDPLQLDISTKLRGGKGTLYEGIGFSTKFNYDSSTKPTYDFNLEFPFDHLFFGGISNFYSFRVKANNSYSNWYDIYLPAAFDLPSNNFMIPERPTQQSQFVYYDGKYIGEAGCCVASAVAAAKEIQEIRSGRGVLQHSVGWFFGATAIGEEGTYNETAFDFLRDNGMMLYKDTKTSYVKNYPDTYFYNDTSGYKGAKSLYLEHQNFEKSKPQKILSWRKLTGDWDEPFGWQDIIDAIQRSSGSSSSVVIASFGIDSAFDAARSNGIMAESYGSARADHTMVVLGWKSINGKDHFICQNSWGANWGDNGLVYIPFYNIRHIVDGNYTGIINFYEIIDDPNAPEYGASSFEWTYAGLNSNGNPILGPDKVTGNGIYVTASEWNDLAGFVKSKTGGDVTEVTSGTPISAEIVNTMANLLKVKTVKPGDAIAASFFNELKDSYNNLV